MPVFAIAACVQLPDGGPGFKVEHSIAYPVRVGNPARHAVGQRQKVLCEIGVLRDPSVDCGSSGGNGGEDALGPGTAARVRATVARLSVVGRKDVVGGDVYPKWVCLRHVPVYLIGKRIAR